MKRWIIIALVVAVAAGVGGVLGTFWSDPSSAALAAYNRNDYSTAYRLWRGQAEKGEAAAAYNLGLLFREGHGVQQDFAEAARWFTSAAKQGFAIAEVDLGALYADGRGVPKDDAEAVKWFRMAAAKGDRV